MTSPDLENLRWLWGQTYDSQHRNRIVERLAILTKLPSSAELASGARGSAPIKNRFDYDVFISHASEDKEFVRSLAKKLEAQDVKVWYDEFTLSVGDGLRRSIDRGLSRSRYGVVVLSHNFFAKEWPQKELDGLVAREAAHRHSLFDCGIMIPRRKPEDSDG